MTQGFSYSTQFRDEQRDVMIPRLKIAFGYMAVPLVVGFSAIDYFFCPEHLLHFLKIRLLVIPVAFLCYQLFRLSIVKDRYFSAPAYLFSLFLGVLNAYFSMWTGAEASPYYAGLNLVGIGGLSFLPWTPRQLLINAINVYGPYFLMLPFFTDEIRLSYFVPNVAFMGATMLIGGISALTFTKLRQTELKGRKDLEHEISSKQFIIEKKTKEGVYLEKLAGQFSPQVVEAIKSGELKITDMLRREVTCIFIDVENSTSRSNRIDYQRYTEVIREFFSRTVDILLKNNVTVGTYLGDGMLGFTNAPQANGQHQKNAINACIELLRDHGSRQRYYIEKWGTEFNVRIGINTGYAYVGFFPNFSRGTYTTLGKPVNLAARLCSRAEQNRICVTKEFLKSFDKELLDFSIRKIDIVTDIKGFEGETFELFSVGYNAEIELNSSSSSCPLCNSSLSVAGDFENTSVLKCEKCGFTDFIDKVKEDPPKKVA